MIEYQFSTWDDMTNRDGRQIFELVDRSGQVDMSGIRERFQKCEVFMICKDGQKLVGMSALKKRNLGYINEIFTLAKSPKAAIWSQYLLEFGYVNVEPAHAGHGIGRRLTHEMLQKYQFDNRNIYATTRIANKKMNTILMKCGMTVTGESYPSRNDDGGRILLWINR